MLDHWLRQLKAVNEDDPARKGMENKQLDVFPTPIVAMSSMRLAANDRVADNQANDLQPETRISSYDSFPQYGRVHGSCSIQLAWG
jgi:hypothetical protein